MAVSIACLNSLFLSKEREDIVSNFALAIPGKFPSKALFDNDSFRKSEDTRFAERDIVLCKGRFLDSLKDNGLKSACEERPALLFECT